MKSSLSRGIIFGAIVGISLGVVIAGSAIAYFANQTNQQAKLAQEQLAILQAQIATNNQTIKTTAQTQSAIATSSLSASATDTARILATTAALQAQITQPTPIPKQVTSPPTSIPPSPTSIPALIPTALPKTINKNQKYEFEKYSYVFDCAKASTKYMSAFGFLYKGNTEIVVKWDITNIEAYTSTGMKLKTSLAGSGGNNTSDIFPTSEIWFLLPNGYWRQNLNDIIRGASVFADFDISNPEITNVYFYITIESKNLPSGTFGWSCPIPH